MKKMTRLLSLVLVLVLCLSVLPVGAAAASSGWQKIDGYWYYYQNGYPVTGWKQISGSWYWFYVPDEWDDYPEGAMVSNYWVEDPAESNNWYWFGSDGKMVSSKWIQNGDYWYYQLSSGKSAMGWLKLGGVWYYFDPDDYGVMATGGPWPIEDSSGVTRYYYFKDSGALYTGWKEFDWGWAYFTSNGAVEEGWKQIGGKWYYFYEYEMVTGGPYDVDGDGKLYYFGSDGAMKTGWQKIDGDYWYFTSSGAAKKDGWLKSGGYWYYFEDYGYYYGGTAYIDSNGYTYEYYFFNSGKMASSYWIHFKDSSGNWVGWAYYLSNGHRIQSGSIKLNGKWYYFSGGWCTNP